MVNPTKCLTTMSSITELAKKTLGTFEVDLGTVHHFSDGLYAKEMRIPKGYTAMSHQHHYSHLSLLAKGSVLVTTDNDSNKYVSPACIEIKAGVNHAILALEDCVWYCIHATNETNADKIDKILIKEV